MRFQILILGAHIRTYSNNFSRLYLMCFFSSDFTCLFGSGSCCLGSNRSFVHTPIRARKDISIHHCTRFTDNSTARTAWVMSQHYQNAVQPSPFSVCFHSCCSCSASSM